MTIHFQAIQHSDKLVALSGKDWLYKLAHQFPIANVMNAETVMRLEAIATNKQTEDMREELNTLIKEMAEKHAMAQSQEVQRSEAREPESSTVALENNKPTHELKMMW